MAVSALASPLEDCANAYDPDEAMAGCSAIVDSTWANDEQLVMAFNNRANAYRLRGRAEAAIDDYSRALALAPLYANALYNRGSLYLELGKLELAIADFDGVMHLEPTHADAMNNRALALLKAGGSTRPSAASPTPSGSIRPTHLPTTTGGLHGGERARSPARPRTSAPRSNACRSTQVPSTTAAKCT
jgi:tetratricopeptide (TPR) repeat protein